MIRGWSVVEVSEREIGVDHLQDPVGNRFTITPLRETENETRPNIYGNGG
jgi:hypothetical protein